MGKVDKPSRRRSSGWVDEEGVGELLRALRLHRELTQQEVAEQADVSPAAITRIETGSRRPSHDVLGRVAAVFGVTEDDLIAAAQTHPADADELEQLADALLAASSDPDRPQTSTSRPRPSPARTPRPAEPTTTSELRLAAALGDERRATQLIDNLARLAEDTPPGHIDQAVDRTLTDLADHLANPERHDQMLPVVAAMPTGQRRSVLANAVGRDHYGRLWIDPLAKARRGGYPDQDPTIERFEDGRIVIDTSHLADSDLLPERDPDRHLLLTRRVDADLDPAALDELAAVYATAVLEIDWDPTTQLTIEPAPHGTTTGPFPEQTDVVHIITAANPRSRLLTDPENDERHRLLAYDLTAAGYTALPAVGRSPDHSWQEASYAIVDADETHLLELARKYEQNAIYRWTPHHRATIWTDHHRDDDTHGWHASWESPEPE